MITIVFDSDGLIKLAKTGVLEKIVNRFDCVISDKVRQEAVTDGKKRLYEDAFQIENLIEKKKLRVIKLGLSSNVGRMAKSAHLGSGELATLELFFRTRNGVVVSEDRTFLSVLEKHNIPFVIPSDLIAHSGKLKILSRKEALGALEKIRPYTRESNYLKAKKAIEVI